MTICQNCGSQNPDDAKFCKSCGSLISTAKMQNPSQSPSNLPNMPPVYQYPPVRNTKDRSLAIILEVLPGLFGFLGFGWIYAGNTSTGLIWLIGFLIWTIIATVISVFTGGIGVICWLPISIGCIIISSTSLNSYTKKHTELFGL